MTNQIETSLGDFHFSWDCAGDRAIIEAEGNLVWEGGLLPSFLLFRSGSGYADSVLAGIEQTRSGEWNVSFNIGQYGSGSVRCEIAGACVSLHHLAVHWNEDTSVIGLYFGAKKLTQRQSLTADPGGVPFFPCWRAEEYCVPCAEGSPTRSFWRKWDLGNAVLPLGSFGPSMGTPYAAAFPRPLYACAMGGKAGWAAMGSGEIPDAALSLRIKAASGCLEYLYREDLWGPSDPRDRSWGEPLRISAGKEAYDAYAALFESLDVPPAERRKHIRSISCTWGSFRRQEFDLRKMADRTLRQTPADVFLIDDSWQDSMGSGRSNPRLFPDFSGDLRYIRELGMKIGLWLSLGWVASPAEEGLSESDLLCGADGRPRLSGWLPDPYLPADQLYFCIDPSSERAREFLRERSRRIMKEFAPAVLKLDFGYGFPGPDVCSPRDPSMRGEKLCRTFLEIVGRAAKEIDPSVTVLFYGISPLMRDCCDAVSLDDMGDCGDSPEYERAGHSQRCLWASLAAPGGTAVNTSSGYFWGAMNDILLDTAVSGASGTVLPETDDRGASLTPAVRLRWLAVQKWRRQATSLWRPLFLDASMGGRGSEPELRSWARVEGTGESRGTVAAALRNPGEKPVSYRQLPGVAFTGSWALISLDGGDLGLCGRLAAIPFSPGTIRIGGSFLAVDEVESGGKETQHGAEASRAELTVSRVDAERVLGYVLSR